MYATQGDDIFVNLYAQSNGKVKAGKNEVSLKQTTQYPWDGKITISVNPLKSGKFAISLRIPGWAGNQPVPTNLYKFTEKALSGYNVRVNGKIVKLSVKDGYVSIDRQWKKGDVIELNLPMSVRRIQAHENVADDKGKLAIERGPIVYCLEGKDQTDKHVFDKYIPENTKMDYTFEKDLLNGVMVLKGNAKEVTLNGEEKDVPFTAIPYSTWNNRGTDEMAVWVPSSAKYTHPTPLPTIASKARTIIVKAPIQNDAPDSASTEEWAWGVNDQWEPKSSSDTSKPYHYWWLKRGTPETLAYEFENEETVSNVEVYWLDIDQYDGNFRVPESWKLYYKDGDSWKEVEAKSPYTTRKDCYNSLDFTPIKTKGLKIVAKLQDGESGGVLEWKVK
jgi:hypothetical protein